MKNNEIGSEFWNIETLSNKKFFMLGRTALEYVIRDALLEGEYSSALLPSYCCHTMIEPFLRNNVKVRFYDVVYEDRRLIVRLPGPIKNEIILVMRYFGYQCIDGYNDLLRWKLIIEDGTHSYFVNTEFKEANYWIASLRKWSGFTGLAMAKKKSGEFLIESSNVINKSFCEMRRNAQIRKYQCLKDGTGDKQEYLELFSEAEQVIENDYIGYEPCQEDIKKYCQLDVECIREKRRENASALISELTSTNNVELIWDTLGEMDVPLNVPIIVEPGIRDSLRRYLIKNRIYCPVHWPLSELHRGISENANSIFNSELSLICDQRYGIEDMKTIARCVKEFFK